MIRVILPNLRFILPESPKDSRSDCRASRDPLRAMNDECVNFTRMAKNKRADGVRLLLRDEVLPEGEVVRVVKAKPDHARCGISLNAIPLVIHD